MRITHATSLLLIINTVNTELFQGNTKNQKREKRQNNSYEFFRRLLSQNNYRNQQQDTYSYNYGIPQHTTTTQAPIYSNLKDKQTFNINHITSDHVTIINNYYPEPTACPCEKYVRNDNGQLECLCPRRQIFIRCATNTICVLKNKCNQGFVDTDGNSDQSDLCDESSHVCCLPRMQNNLEETQKNTNQFINSTIRHFSSPVTKYIIHGNLYLNSDNSEYNHTDSNNQKRIDDQTPQPLSSTDLNPLFNSRKILTTQKPSEDIPTGKQNKESTRSPSQVDILTRTSNTPKVPSMTDNQIQTMELIPMMVNNDSLILPMMVIKMNNRESTLSVLSQKDLQDIFSFYSYMLKEANIK